MFDRGIKFWKFHLICTTNQYGSDIAEHSAFGRMEIKQLPFNSGILVDLLGKSIPNTHFTEIFFSQSWLKCTYPSGSQAHTENKGLASVKLAIIHSSAAVYSEIPMLMMACYWYVYVGERPTAPKLKNKEDTYTVFLIETWT